MSEQQKSQGGSKVEAEERINDLKEKLSNTETSYKIMYDKYYTVTNERDRLYSQNNRLEKQNDKLIEILEKITKGLGG